MPGKKSKKNDGLLAALNLAAEIPPPPTLEPTVRKARQAPGPIKLKPLSEDDLSSRDTNPQSLTELNQALFQVKLPPGEMPPQFQRRRDIVDLSRDLGRPARIFRDWGIPEWFVVSQAMLLALMFVPGLSSIRFFTKMASFFTSLVALCLVIRDGRISKVGSGQYKPKNWLI